MMTNAAKQRLGRIFTLFIVLLFVLTSCSAPPPHVTKTLQTPLGAVSLDMTRKQIESLYAMEYELDLEGSVLTDYGPIVVLYDLKGNAVSVRSFEPGITTSTGVAVGMPYADVLAKSPDWAVETTVRDNPAIIIDYQGEGEKASSAIGYTTVYRFEDGVVERIIIAYPGYTTA